MCWRLKTLATINKHISIFLSDSLRLLALLFKKNPVENKKFEREKDSYNEEEDVFMNYFDDDGNFIEVSPEVEIQETIKLLLEDGDNVGRVTVTYSYKESRDADGEL